MSSDRANLAKLLQQLPKGTEVFVRQGEECGPALPVILDDGDKLTLYLTTLHQQLKDRELDRFLEGEGFLKPYPHHLREVCPHGRAVMGTCSSCDLPDIMSLNEELKALENAADGRRARILAGVVELVKGLVDRLDVEAAIKAREIEMEEVAEAFALALCEALGEDAGV